MDEILNLSINEMPQTEFDCSCGKHHNFSVHDMSIRKGAIEDLPKMAEPFKDGKILVEEHFGWVGSQSVNWQPGVIPCGYITKRMSQQEIADFVAEAIDHYNYIAC